MDFLFFLCFYCVCLLRQLFLIFYQVFQTVVLLFVSLRRWGGGCVAGRRMKMKFLLYYSPWKNFISPQKRKLPPLCTYKQYVLLTNSSPWRRRKRPEGCGKWLINPRGRQIGMELIYIYHRRGFCCRKSKEAGKQSYWDLNERILWNSIKNLFY